MMDIVNISEWIDLDELAQVYNRFERKGWIDAKRGIELTRDISSGKISVIARKHREV